MRSNSIQKLCARRKTNVGHLQQKTTCQAKAFVDLKRAVDVWVINQALPANGRSWLLEIHTHNDVKVILRCFSVLMQSFCIFDSGARIVNRARAYNHDQTVLFVTENGLQVVSTLRDSFQSLDSEWQFLHNNLRWNERLYIFDMAVIQFIDFVCRRHGDKNVVCQCIVHQMK